MKKITISLLLISLSIVGLCQNGTFRFALSCKTINNLDSIKFHYIIHEKGNDLIQVLRKDDINNCESSFVIPFSKLVRKDKTLENIPEIPEGKYALWIVESNSWIVLKGGLKEITNLPQDKKTSENCELAHFGKFKYINNPDTSAYILRKENKQTEHYENNSYFTEFEIKWLSDCEYELTFMQTNDLKMSFLKKGDTLKVKVSNVTAKGYNYSANLKGNVSQGAHLKIE